MYLLEVCVDSLASARAAIAGGADRLEVCSALAVGGLTPDPELVRQIRSLSSLPIRCLIRPRPGDFLYQPDELALMTRQISNLLEAGADGAVIGCLTPDGHLDSHALAPLIRAVGNSGLTLHRAMDVSAVPEDTWTAAADLGFDTVLTSGAAPTAVQGLDTISRLLACAHSQGGPRILIGSGICAQAVARILSACPLADAFHMSGKTAVPSGMRFRRAGIPMGVPGFDEWSIPRTDAGAVRQVRNILDCKGKENHENRNYPL